jgi:chemotaxis protein CheZ
LKKVIALVQEVEENLVKLVRMASKVEAIAGIKYVPDNNPVVAANEAEGPIVNAAERDDVVTGQDEVDDLLSSLGF